MPDPPILIVSPQDDTAFRRLAEEGAAAGADTPRALERPFESDIRTRWSGPAS